LKSLYFQLYLQLLGHDEQIYISCDLYLLYLIAPQRICQIVESYMLHHFKKHYWLWLVKINSKYLVSELTNPILRLFYQAFSNNQFPYQSQFYYCWYSSYRLLCQRAKLLITIWKFWIKLSAYADYRLANYFNLFEESFLWEYYLYLIFSEEKMKMLVFEGFLIFNSVWFSLKALHFMI
jgi:hypothetical protein